MAKLMKREDFDSDEELYFYEWIMEAVGIGLIDEWSYHQYSYILTPKYRLPMADAKYFTLQPHNYTPDFFIYFNEQSKYRDMISNLVTYAWMGTHIDVKGIFNRNGGDRLFSMNRKMMMKEHNIPVHKIVPEKFFKKTWVPESIVAGKRIARLKKWDGCRLLKEVIDAK